jgi:6-phosphogluconolactonase
MNPSRLLVSPDPTWPEYAASIISELLRERQATVAGNRVTLALSGGSTPVPVYQRLATTPNLNWRYLDIFLCDERMVPYHHEESNYRSVRRNLSDQLPYTIPTLHPVTTHRTPDAAARDYEAIIRRELRLNTDRQPVFDLVVLGLGADGHTASLFPDQDTLREERRLVIPARHPETGQWRITFSLPLITAAHTVVFLVTGADKAQVLERVCGVEPDHTLPASLVAARAQSLIWLMDEAAAARIKRP